VAQAARLALGDGAVAVTAVSDSLASGELEEAETLAQQIGIRHRVIRTEEFADPNYVRNNTDRCYFCKSELYGRLAGLLGELGVDAIASGANTDDLGDHRPGMRAASENGVRHPLQECGLGKAEVRALAKAWGLPTWDKPATPCLSSRIAYGEDVTPERVKMIDAAEGWLRKRGLILLRVRYHKGDLARVEVPLEEISRLAAPGVREEMTSAFRALGFKYVTIDLDGLRSGSMNAVIPIGLLQKPANMAAAR
jgi:pyridinium-3,5-biscarboxylic acid mononucleotide sulfurtransferase